MRVWWAAVVGGIAACGIFPDADSITSDDAVDDDGDTPLADSGIPDEVGVDAPVPIAPDAAPIDVSPDGSPLGGYAAAVLADAPLAYLPLDEDDGPFALDASGHGNVGTLGGAPSRINSGRVGRALDLAGNGAISLGPVFDFDLKKPYSLEIWVRFAFSDSAYRHLFDKSSPMTPRRGFGVFSREGALTFERWVDNSQVATSKGGEVGWLNAWIQVVAVYDGVALTTYVNGDPFSTGADARSQMAANTGTFVVGAKTGTGENAILGAIDEVAIYDAPLPQARIRAHYVAALAK